MVQFFKEETSFHPQNDKQINFCEKENTAGASSLKECGDFTSNKKDSLGGYFLTIFAVFGGSCR